MEKNKKKTKVGNNLKCCKKLVYGNDTLRECFRKCGRERHVRELQIRERERDRDKLGKRERKFLILETVSTSFWVKKIEGCCCGKEQRELERREYGRERKAERVF